MELSPEGYVPGKLACTEPSFQNLEPEIPRVRESSEGRDTKPHPLL